MACYHPLQAYRFPPVGNTKSTIYFKKLDQRMESLKLPCGQCVGCRLARSRMWATRCVHESKSYDQNAFITLTYNDEHCPYDGSLIKSHFQNFMKRLRKSIDGKRIKYFHAGEYGEENKRPHYHACIFGHDFSDKALWSVRDGVHLYTSDDLDALWGMGFCTVGDVTWQSAAYVARYVMKKVNGALRDKPDEITGLRPYERILPDTGEVVEVVPEYTTMSNGIGKSYYENYSSDFYRNDNSSGVYINGHDTTVPRYYDNLFQIDNPEKMAEIKEQRVKDMRKHAHDNTPERLADRETVKKAQISFLKRAEL